jgi:hypothetical protein
MFSYNFFLDIDPNRPSAQSFDSNPPLNFDIQTIVLAKQLMSLSSQLAGLNIPTIDTAEYLSSLNLKLPLI